MPILLFQILTIAADLVLFIFVGYYLLQVRAREKELAKKANKIDTGYHQVLDDALLKERKILDDATHEADHILTDAQYVNRDSTETVNQALKKIVTDIQKDAIGISQEFTVSYQASLKELSAQSLTDFQNVAKELEGDLKKQVKEFHEILLPNLEKELEDYKQARLKQTEQMITHIIQKVSQEVLNKSISLEDHQNLLVESLEKAKKEAFLTRWNN